MLHLRPNSIARHVPLQGRPQTEACLCAISLIITLTCETTDASRLTDGADAPAWSSGECPGSNRSADDRGHAVKLGQEMTKRGNISLRRNARDKQNFWLPPACAAAIPPPSVSQGMN